jgi:1-acyl-sn-glycerol-3-phosphate acyltransferase
MTDSVRSFRFYGFANRALRLVLPLLLRIRVTGLENVPPRGPVIVAFNHTMFLDPPLLGTYIPRRLVPLAKVEAFSIPVLGSLIRWYGSIPVRRGAADRRALYEAMAALRNGYGLIIAPEGTRSPNHQLLRPRAGVVFIAWRSGAPVLPVGISGVGRFWHNLSRLRRTDVELRIGPPFHFVCDERRPSRKAMEQMAEEAMYRLAALLPPEQRGPYGDLHLATTRYIELVPPTSDRHLSPQDTDGPAAH